MKVQITDKHGYTDRHGNEHPFGTVAEFTDHLAVKLMNRGVARPAPKPEHKTATKAPAEHASKRVGKPAPRTVKPSKVKEDDDA